MQFCLPIGNRGRAVPSEMVKQLSADAIRSLFDGVLVRKQVPCAHRALRGGARGSSPAQARPCVTSRTGEPRPALRGLRHPFSLIYGSGKRTAAKKRRAGLDSSLRLWIILDGYIRT